MKRIFTLFVALFVAMSLVGQVSPTKGMTEILFEKTFSHQKAHKNQHFISGVNDVVKFNRLNSSQYLLGKYEDTKQALSSVLYTTKNEEVLVNDYKEEYVYDSSGRLSESITYSWQIDKWVGSEKSVFIYDSSGRIAQYTASFWDDTIWTPYFKLTFTYDANGNVLEEIDYTWDGSDFVLYWKYSYTYNDSQQLIEEIDYEWNGSSWVNDFKSTFSYDDSGNMIEAIFYTFDGTSWTVVYKVENVYDGSGNMLELIAYTWDGSVWLNYYKFTNAYDDSDNTIESIEYFWDGFEWVPDWKDNYSYNESNILIELIESIWDGTKWVNDYKSNFTFDELANLFSYYDYIWDNGLWLEATRVFSFNFDNNYSFEDLIFPINSLFESEFYSTWLFNHMLLGYDMEQKDGDTWVKEGDATFAYQELVLGLSKFDELGAKIFPNPTSDYINFELSDISNSAKIELFDANGRLLLSQEIPKTKQISLRHLDSGVYFYHISSDSKSSKGKIVLK